MTQSEDEPGSRSSSPWARHPIGSWTLARTGDRTALFRAGRAAQAWARRHGLAARYRTEDGALWVLFTGPDAPAERRARGPRSRWAAHPVGSWVQAQTLTAGDARTLIRLGATAQAWAARHGLRGEFRIRDEGRTLWVRFTAPGAACDCGQPLPCRVHRWSGEGARG